MAVGVGKTCRMLQEGRSVAAGGKDVAIGLLETHGRPETAALAEGLELIPRRSVAVEGTVFDEMDLPAILRRAPRVCLIDELAHTNAPGLEHHQRYEDVEDVLAAGIDVFSTVNVQHLRSVSERIAEKTGIAVQETMPDRVVDEADEVVVVDLTPEALQTRILEGKVFPADDVPVALKTFFTKDNLDVLREIALLQVVEEVEAHRLTAEMLNDEDRLISNVPAERSHRFLGLVKPDPSANRIVRRAWTIAERLGGAARSAVGLLAGTGRRSRDQSTRGRTPSPGRRLRRALDRRGRSQRGTDGGARGRRTGASTHIVMGTPHLRQRFGRPRWSLVDEIVAGDPSLDVVLVGDSQPNPSDER